MSLSQDTRELLAKQMTERENIRKRMDALVAAGDAEIEEAANRREESAKGNEESGDDCQPDAPLGALSQGDCEPCPVPTEDAPRKPWLDARGHQFRPQTRLERETEEMEEFDRAQLAALERDRKDSELDRQSWELAEKWRKEREAKIARTGRRPLPQGRGEVIINKIQFGTDTSSGDLTPLDPRTNNSRGNPSSFGGGL